MDSHEDEDAKRARSLSSGPPPGHALVGPDQPEAESQPESGPEPWSESGQDSRPGSQPEPHLQTRTRTQPQTQLPLSLPPQSRTEPEPEPEPPHYRQLPPPPAAPPAPPEPRPTGGISALSLPYQVAAALSLAIVGALACVHLGMVFLHVAPSNTVTKQHGKAVDGWIYPEFEQNWKLFAPNPLQQNVAVQVRAEVSRPDGSRRNTDWIDLTAEDGEAIRGNLLPSHVQQNELRRGWDFYLNSHDNEDRPNGRRGRLSESYIRRIVMLRLEAHDLGGPVERIQLRSATRAVKAPEWSDEKTDTRPFHRVLPWWTVTTADLPGGVRNGRPEASR
ncbi:DUF5819 family protein [Streptomyces sp. NPDC052236]|uniref:DUF5819 family protein n=1 Tax=Streptomyces sp. NPDC052236 TaxID=3365686 RepID=UPI0037D27489